MKITQKEKDRIFKVALANLEKEGVIEVLQTEAQKAAKHYIHTEFMRDYGDKLRQKAFSHLADYLCEDLDWVDWDVINKQLAANLKLTWRRK